MNNTHFLDRIGDVLAAVQKTTLPSLPDDTEWDIRYLGNMGKVYKTCAPDALAETFSAKDIQTDDETSIVASLCYTFSADTLLPLVNQRMRARGQTPFDQELLTAWLDLENMAMAAFAEQYKDDAQIQDILQNWPMKNFEQPYALSLPEKRSLADEAALIEVLLEEFCEAPGHESYLADYQDCKSCCFDDDMQTELRVTIDFVYGTDEEARVSLAIAAGDHMYSMPELVVATLSPEQLASATSIYPEVRDMLKQNLATEQILQSFAAPGV